MAAGLFFSGAAFAHGGKAHAHGAHQAAMPTETAGTSGPAFAVVQGADDRAIAAAHAHQHSGSDCPSAGTDCCSTHCCAPAGLRVEPPHASPARISTRGAIGREGPPPDAAREALFRPPCR